MNTEKPIKSERRIAVIYCRVSSVKQTTRGDGLSSQTARCQEYADYRGYEVVDVFKDDMSGGIADRPGMKAMLEFVHKMRRFQPIVIIDDISRLARDIQIHKQLRAAIATCGGVLESPTIEFGETSDELMVEDMLAVVAEHGRRKNREVTKGQMQARGKNGYWQFCPPKGYRYELQPGSGKVLIRDEPLASVIQEALEGFASGRLQTQVEVKRFLEAQPLFPKNKKGTVTNQRVKDILTQPIYAGYLRHNKWGYALKKGNHEGLISLQVFERIQDRLSSKTRAPARKDLTADFVLRGFVACGDCNHPLTACWSTSKTGKKHPYYQCFQKGCPSSRKSVRRDKLEEDFEALVKGLTPTKALVDLAHAMFKKIWEHRRCRARDMAHQIQTEVTKVQSQIDGLVDRIVDANSDSVIRAYESRIKTLEEQKVSLEAKAQSISAPKKGFEEAFRTPMEFLASPWKLWASGDMIQRRMLMKLAFAHAPQYHRERGFSNPTLSLPFKALEAFRMGKHEMARPQGFEPWTR